MVPGAGRNTWGHEGPFCPISQLIRASTPCLHWTPPKVPGQNCPISGLPRPLMFYRKSNITSERCCGLEMPTHSSVFCFLGVHPSLPYPALPQPQARLHPSLTYCSLCPQGLRSRASSWTERLSASSCISPSIPSPVWTSLTGLAAASVGRSVASTASSRWKVAGATVAQATASGGCGDELGTGDGVLCKDVGDEGAGLPGVRYRQ